MNGDEEPGFWDTRNGGGGGEFSGGSFPDGEDHNWLTKLLREVDSINPDGVLSGGENFPNPHEEARLQFPQPPVQVVDIENEGGGDDEDDDDCIVLEGDPEKPVLVGNGNNSGGSDDDSDAVEIIAEKGEVACRDFPHPRYLCATYPFASTSHEVHCAQCHCYVCDSLAPCAHWGTGLSSSDHCHASDKEGFWKKERNSRKKGDNPVPVPKITASFGRSPQTTQVAVLPSPQASSLQPSVGLRPDAMRPRSMPSDVNVPSAVNQRRNLMLGHNNTTYVPQQRWVSPSFPAISGGIYRLSPARAVFKRTGFSGASPSYCGSQLSTNPALRRCHSLQTPVSDAYFGSNQLNSGSLAPNSRLTHWNSLPLSSMDTRFLNDIHSRPQLHVPIASGRLIQATTGAQMPTQQNLGSNFISAAPFQLQGASQPSVGEFENMIPSQPDLVFPANHSVPPQAFVSNQSDAGMTSGTGSQLHPNMGNTFVYQPSQPGRLYNHSSSLFVGQNDFQQGTLSDQATNVVDDNFNWVDFIQAPTNLSQVHNEVPRDSLQSLTGSLALPVSSNRNVFSSEPASVDAATY